MTSEPVDLSNLRVAIDNDKELEEQLFTIFIDSSAEHLEALQAHCAGGNNNEVWRETAHALKGICANLGADRLHKLAGTAQESHEASMEEKKNLLADIQEELKQVVDFLNNVS